MTELKTLKNLFKFKKMTKKQKLYLEKLRKEFKEGKITVEEGHRLWESHPDYIKQYGNE